MTPAEAALRKAETLPIWSGPVTAEPLEGGITNLNFTVADAGRRYVVRIGEDIPAHGISRSAELAAARAAHAAGVGPAVRHAGPGVLVVDWIDGRPLDAAAVRAPANRPRLADLLRRTHHDVPRWFRGPAPIFWVFQVIRDYAATLAETASPHAPRLARLTAEAAALEEAVGPVRIVFGHNDLLPANIIDDGDRLWLIDWEYAGFNSPLFDLGGLASNAGMDAGERALLLDAYLGHAADPGLARALDAMTAASLLRETMWSMVSEARSTIDFDYAAYTAENLARYEAALAAFRESHGS
ncbi:choline/ethanolamine kinase family protein [Amaricoccus sp.]|uniref:choline/ethanolamine kinase family protein n=1 Tax=Amaricoccus sp. TaxID=1872485 RepID=UPI001B61AC1D|nr:choline/ethanolamine kinase family protein [Amaricoccus sp.]MBP7002648.1 phosphotransferase family protein [Amaricoccus sp.]